MSIPRTRHICVSTAILLLFACGPTDPLEKVRHLQDEERDFAASIPILQQLIDERPEAEVFHRYGLALIARGDQGLAVWPLRKAMEDPAWLRESGMPLAAALVKAGAYDDGIEVVNQVLEANPDDIEALLLRADAYVRSRRFYDEALVDAERVLEMEPDQERALATKTVALLALERVDEAAVALEQLEAFYRDDSLDLHASPGYCAARATFEKEKGETERAAERFDECLENFPTDAIVMREALSFYDGLGRSERSLEILEAALEADPVQVYVRARLALRLRAAGKVEEAYARMREGTEVASPPAAAEAWATIASFHTADGDHDAALEAYEQALALDGGRSSQLLFAHADALVIAERYEEALAAAGRLAIPAQRELVRGRVALGRGDPERALKHFTEGTRLWPDNAVARYYTAVAAERLGSFGRAIEEYRAAMRIEIEATNAYLRLARIHAAAKRDGPAMMALRLKQGGRPEELEAGLLELRILARQGTERIPDALLRRYAAPSLWARASRAIAEGFAERAGPEEALAYLRSREPLDTTDPQHFEILDLMVDLLGSLDRDAEAVSVVEAAIASHPEEADFHALHGRLLARGGNAEEARAAYQRALSQDAEHADALAGLARLEAEAGDTDAAIARLERAAGTEPADPAHVRALAEQLVVAGRREDAESRLLELLGDRPWDAETALALARSRHARGEARGVVELARRAVRFGGGDDARAFLAEVAPESAAEPDPDDAIEPESEPASSGGAATG